MQILDTTYKKTIERMVQPIAQIENINDWYKFYIATYELFDGYSLNINNPNNEWIKKTNDSDIFAKNVQNVKKLMEKLK